MAHTFRPFSWFRSDDVENQVRVHDVGEISALPGNVQPPGPRSSLRDQIALRAYRRWCAEGCPLGRDLDYWLAAERQLLEEIAHQRSPRFD